MNGLLNGFLAIILLLLLLICKKKKKKNMMVTSTFHCMGESRSDILQCKNHCIITAVKHEIQWKDKKYILTSIYLDLLFFFFKCCSRHLIHLIFPFVRSNLTRVYLLMCYSQTVII